MPRFADAYLKMLQGEPPQPGPWNEGSGQMLIDNPEPAIDGGDGMASVKLDKKQQAALDAMRQRLESDPSSDPQTGAELGMPKVGTKAGAKAGVK